MDDTTAAAPTPEPGISTSIPRALRKHETSSSDLPIQAGIPDEIPPRGEVVPTSTNKTSFLVLANVSVVLAPLALIGTALYWLYALYAHAFIYFQGTIQEPEGDGTTTVTGTAYNFFNDPMSIMGALGVVAPLVISFIALSNGRRHGWQSVVTIAAVGLGLSVVAAFLFITATVYMGKPHHG